MRKKLTLSGAVASVLLVAFVVLVALGMILQSVFISACAFLVGIVGIVSGGILLKQLSGIVIARQDAIHTRIGHLETTSVELENQVSTVSREVRENGKNLQDRAKVLRKDIQVLRRRVPAGYLDSMQSDVAMINDTGRETLRIAFESAIRLGRDPKSVLSDQQARRLFDAYIERGQFLNTRPLLENFDVVKNESLTSLRRLYQYYRKSGYWELALLVVCRIHTVTGRDTDRFAAEKIHREIKLFKEPEAVDPELPDGDAYSSDGPILHMVGRVLPETQTGYTLRTQYTALSQQRKGLPVAIVGQTGITGTDSPSIEHYRFQEMDYYLLPGSPRSQMMIDTWLEENIEQLAELVRTLKPSILHAQSDFFNALIVNAVGKKYGIPTVYESRGFWEESWLSRSINANNQMDSYNELSEMYGEPDAYVLRKHAEEIARLQPDHVFTLAEVMRQHILNSANGLIPNTSVSLVPNAVEQANFPVQERDDALLREIGLPEDAVVVGYISSMVEYEGIDTLIKAYDEARQQSSEKMCLLLVGDGDYLDTLRELVRSEEIEDVYFTGRVPHEDVLMYYGIIDIFVVPRKASTVANLVTPLKPFEAFSTGRAVILSDVDALNEIALQSSAVDTFSAGSALDLASKLVKLVGDPERRKSLGDRAQRWVRNHRSWDSNVNEYYRVYRELGYSGFVEPVVLSELSITSQGANPGEILAALAQSEIPALTGWFSIQENRQSASEILDVGWRFAGFDPVPVARLTDWSIYGQEHRSWGFHLHAWEFMDSILREYDATGKQSWLRAAIDIAISWFDLHRSSESDVGDPMAWYDMSLSLRTPRLIAITLRAARFPDLRDDVVVLAEGVSQHLQELHKERSFNPNNNHGFYTAISQVHAAKYAWMFPGSKQSASEGQVRLSRMAESQFASDGVHMEHSPDYHRMLLASFERGVNDNLIQDADVQTRVRRAAHVLGWMIQPDGALVQFGDSPETILVKPGSESIDPETHFILSEGACGTQPQRELAVFREGGYAFVRSPQPSQDVALNRSSYLAFSAAFHSRAHKHADDLNVVWFDRGSQILTDGGRYGYGDLLPADSPLRKEGFYYSAPERQYVEGTMAHNTLMMDGANQDRRTRTPYGGAIGECSEEDGVFDLSGRVHHLDYIHRRRVIFTPGTQLRVKDSIFSQSPDNREGILWFNIPGEFELISTEDNIVEFHLGSETNPLNLEVRGPGRLVEPVRGQTGPLRGWRSRKDRKLEPVWSLGFAISIDTRASVETVFNLSMSGPSMTPDQQP
ncbi:hypothetical protein GCM10009689_29120 [Brevibacterium antiquum]|uniref:glycosyltransferase n=1 Tax=Brevibacterium antiquum TaxID=234835 RepID=UPI0018DF1E23|nr:glycosyltransferase [Brevibacterium antiquum]